jgi:hypothetical protein
MKTLHVGINIPVKKGTLLENLSVNKFCSGTLIETDFIIDLDGRRLDKPKLKKILEKTTNNVICRVSNVDRIKDLTKYFNKIYYYNSDASFNIFHILSAVFTDENRKRVYNQLKRWNPPLRVLMKWIISNIDIEDDENILWIQTIDSYMEKVRPEIIWKMISLIRPIYPLDQRYYYRFKKIGG